MAGRCEMAQFILYASLAYVAAGLLFAAAFVIVRIHSIDPAASRGTLGFRMVIFPGVAALWPLLLMKWARRA